MTQASTNTTYKKQALGNATGIGSVANEQLTVEFLAADPTDLTTNFPRVWINTTSGIMKFTTNGTTTKTITAT